MSEKTDQSSASRASEGDLRAAARALAAELQPALDAHPPPEELLAYQSHSLADAQRERVAEHLSLCRECALMVVGLETALAGEPPEGALPPSRAVVAARWEELQQRLRPGWISRWLSFLRQPVTSRGFLSTAAIAALAAILGLSLWVIGLRGTVAELSGPRLNVYVADLEPAPEALRRSDGGGSRLAVPADAENLLLLLDLGDRRSFSDYRLEISDAGGHPVWSSHGLRRTPDGNFTVALPRSFLPAGRYHLSVFGLEGQQEVPLVEYALELEYE